MKLQNTVNIIAVQLSEAKSTQLTKWHTMVLERC